VAVKSHEQRPVASKSHFLNSRKYKREVIREVIREVVRGVVRGGGDSDSD
jgi:hypothetical protein